MAVPLSQTTNHTHPHKKWTQQRSEMNQLNRNADFLPFFGIYKYFFQWRNRYGLVHQSSLTMRSERIKLQQETVGFSVWLEFLLLLPGELSTEGIISNNFNSFG